MEGTDDDGPTDGSGDGGRSCCCNLGCKNWNDHSLHLHSCSENDAVAAVEAAVEAPKLQTCDLVQGGTSGCSLGLVDFKTTAEF